MMKKLLMGVFLLCTIAVFTAPAYAAFSDVVSFGDSLSDNGITNYPVVDEEGFTRFSNGHVWVEYLAEEFLGIPHDGRAYGGALSGLGEYNLLWQVDRYTDLDHNPTDISNTLFTVWAGGNDLRALMSDPNANAQAVIGQAVFNISTAVSWLYAEGARNIIVPNLPDLGKIPETNWNATISGMATAATMGFNGGLEGMIAGLRSNYGDLTIYDLDIFNYLNNVVIPGGFFLNTTDPWMGSGENPADYLFYDYIHPTTDAHWLLAQYAASAVPIPGTVLLFCSGLVGLAGLRRRKSV